MPKNKHDYIDLQEVKKLRIRIQRYLDSNNSKLNEGQPLVDKLNEQLKIVNKLVIDANYHLSLAVLELE